MNANLSGLKYEEQVVFALRALYGAYGYSQFKMSKFEEYDLYSTNKDFLISDNIITFTDINGRLMALKPDVTLSIVKNSKDIPNSVQKFYYNENVYRSSKSGGFREIMQVGLECIGAVDDYCICETLALAAQSLLSISADSVLKISHLGILQEVLGRLDVTDAVRQRLLKCVGEKNAHEIESICREAGVDGSELKKLVTTYGRPQDVLPKLSDMLPESDAASQLTRVIRAVESAGFGDMLRIDFSIVSNMRYYNGLSFSGFVSGVPESVLSGGQYDRLMQRMGRRSRAIGFAVYLDLLERLDTTERGYDVDVVLLYDADSSPEAVYRSVSELRALGLSVMAQRSVPEKLKYKKLLKISGNGVTTLEQNA